MRTADFDYFLPPELIAQVPIEPRDASRLMIVDRRRDAFSHQHFRDLPGSLSAGDCLVLNNTRVLPARLKGKKAATGGKVEVLLLNELDEKKWEALVRPAARLKEGSTVIFDDRLVGKVEESLSRGRRIISFETDGEFRQLLREIGEIPLPRYIRRPLKDSERYQTVYSLEERSAAAPTAGLHFTSGLLQKIEEKGIKIVFLTLEVGLDTFRPIKEENIEDHQLHSEAYNLTLETAAAINQTIESGGRIVAVGTTTTRVLESCAVRSGSGCDSEGKRWRVKPNRGRTGLYIYPGYAFKIVDCLITNFHLPRTTLLVLVSAFAGTDLIKRAYQEAIERRYRFYSFGDAMLIF